MRPKRTSDAAGFALVELLVVIIIIGVLAAIAVPLFMRQREKGWDLAVESDLRNAAIAQDAFLTEGTAAGHYATSVAQLTALGFRPSSPDHYFGGAFALGIGVTGSQYCLMSRSQSGRYLAFSSAVGLVVSSTPLDPATCR